MLISPPSTYNSPIHSFHTQPPNRSTQLPPRTLFTHNSATHALRASTPLPSSHALPRPSSHTCAASEMSRMTRSESATTSNTSPSVPSLAEKPVASASAHEGDPLRRPMATGMLRPAVAIESWQIRRQEGGRERVSWSKEGVVAWRWRSSPGKSGAKRGGGRG
eukprot:359426-Chlamydomonas_euryale.AAC.6